jgi:hypothetical protein
MKSLITASIIGLSSVLILTSCEKVAGPGGTSAIRGNVVGLKNNLGESEVIEITVMHGLNVEHGDYFLVNGDGNNNRYYIWYNNPTWVSNGDPNLTGRTGIQVDFNYSDSNTDIATNTAAAMNAVLSAEFTIEVNGDILTLTSKNHVNLSDADNGSSNFNVDVANQGKDDQFGTEIAIADEHVYLIYADGTTFNETARTGANGEFTFEGLQVGKYKVYALTQDTITGEKTPVYKTIEISEKASINEIGTFSIRYE